MPILAPTPTPSVTPIEGVGPSILPSLQVPLARTPFHVLTADRSMMTVLMASLLARSGFSLGEVARRLGVKKSTLQAYVKGKRPNPGILWLINYAQICGATLTVQFRPDQA